MSSRTILRICALTLVLAAVAWGLAPPYAPPGVGTGAAPSLLHPWPRGLVTLSACEPPPLHNGVSTAAWCTEFDVPEKLTEPGGRRIHLRVAVVHWTSAASTGATVP